MGASGTGQNKAVVTLSAAPFPAWKISKDMLVEGSWSLLLQLTEEGGPRFAVTADGCLPFTLCVTAEKPLWKAEWPWAGCYDGGRKAGILSHRCVWGHEHSCSAPGLCLKCRHPVFVEKALEREILETAESC